MANILNWRNELKFSSGDTIRVHQKVQEGDKTRTQIFEGLVIRIRGHEGLKSFTVRKIAAGGIGVEKIFPEFTPTVTKVELKKKGKVRRAHLTYLRSRVGKKATKVKDVFVKGAVPVSQPEPQLTKSAVTPPTRLTKAEKEALAARAARKAAKEKKKSKKKQKVERKERVFRR